MNPEYCLPWENLLHQEVGQCELPQDLSSTPGARHTPGWEYSSTGNPECYGCRTSSGNQKDFENHKARYKREALLFTDSHRHKRERPYNHEGGNVCQIWTLHIFQIKMP